MGRTTTPQYRLEMNDGTKHVQAWRGAVSEKRLQDFILSYAKSLELGGVNEHISLSLGRVPYPFSARIVRQRTSEVVAEWKAGMFQVW